MGYLTKFELEVYKLNDRKLNESYNHYDIIDKLRNTYKNDYISYAINSDGNSRDQCKWYEHEEDMKIYSELELDVIFKLLGKGENNEDMWIKYFYNGNMQKCNAIITYPEFDYNKIKEE